MSNLIERTCPVCGVDYAMPKDLYDYRAETGDEWWCPNGHSLVIKQRTSEKYRREAERLRQENARLEETVATKDRSIAEQKATIKKKDRSISAHKGRLTRLKNRNKEGLCSCCGKYFPDLEHHMKRDHPDVDKHEAFTVIEGGQ